MPPPRARQLQRRWRARRKEVVRASGRARFPPRFWGKRACDLHTIARFLARCLGARASVCSGVGAPRPHSRRYASRQGEFPNEQLVRFQAGKIFRVLLDGGRQQAIVKSDGTFAIYDV